MTKNVYTIGFLIFIIIIAVFFITNIFFRDIHYYNTSVLLNAFFVPFICAVGAYLSVTAYSRYKKVLSFKEAFGRAFMPMFVAGVLSLSFIYTYISYIDTDTKDLLNHQYIESYKQSLEDEYQKAKEIIKPDTDEMKDLEEKYAEGKLRIEAKENKKEDMFSFEYFIYIFGGFNLFFIILSVFFGSFFRSKKGEKILHHSFALRDGEK